MKEEERDGSSRYEGTSTSAPGFAQRLVALVRIVFSHKEGMQVGDLLRSYLSGLQEQEGRNSWGIDGEEKGSEKALRFTPIGHKMGEEGVWSKCQGC